VDGSAHSPGSDAHRGSAHPGFTVTAAADPERARIGEPAPLHGVALRYAVVGRAFVRAYCLLVFAAGLAAGVLAALDDPPFGGVDPARLAVLSALALGSLVLSLVSERRRTQVVAGPTWDVHSTWLFAAALLLPVRVTLLLSLVLVVHALAVRRATPARAGLFWGGSVLGLIAARAVVGWDTPKLTALSVLAAAAALFLVQSGAVLLLSRMVAVSRSWSAAVGEPVGLLAEASCLSLGALLAIGIAADVWYAAIAVPALLLVEASSHVPTLRRSAEVDVKTGLQNSEHWHRQAAVRLEHARHRDGSASVVLLDVDRFKAVNDSVGHVAGDAVLAAVAQASTGQLRSGDVIGRFGGDEIVALLVSASADQARVVGERMRVAVSELQVVTRGVDGAPLRVDGLTVSVGVAGTDSGGYELADLLLAADGALLQAKRTGRNRVCTA